MGLTCASCPWLNETLEEHTEKVMSKLDIHDRVELTRFAIREGLAKVLSSKPRPHRPLRKRVNYPISIPDDYGWRPAAKPHGDLGQLLYDGMSQILLRGRRLVGKAITGIP